MSVAALQPAVPKPALCWYHLTPGRFVLLLLAVEVLLWASDRFGWLGWHKGYAVLAGVAVVGVATLLMLLWFGVALVLRWGFQFSLRLLLAMVVVVALPCSWMAVEMRKEQREVTLVAQLGGSVDWSWPSGPAWLQSRLGASLFCNVRGVHLSSLPVTDAELERLRGLTHVTSLYLDDTRVTDAGLEQIGWMTTLRVLLLSNTKTTDAGLGHLKGLTKLGRLDLDQTKITDAGLECLRCMPRLWSLHLDRTCVTDAGLEYVGVLTGLE